MNLSRRYPCGVQLDLSNGFPSPFVASSLYQGSCFAKHWVEVPFQHRLFLVAVPYLVSGFITSWCGSYQLVSETGSSGLAYPFYSFSVSIFRKKKTIRVLYYFFFLLVLFLFSFLKSVTIVVNFFVTLVSLFKSCSSMCLLLLPSLFVSLFLFSFLKKNPKLVNLA